MTVALSLTLLAVLSAPARAQDLGFDATGPDAPPLGAGEPITLWSARSPVKGETRAGALGEAASGLLFEVGDAGATSLLPVAAGLGLSGSVAPSDRVAVGLTAALWPAAFGGPAVGDARVHGVIGLVPGDGPTATVSPWLALPTGGDARGVAPGGPSGGAVLAASAPVGPLRVHGQLGGVVRRRGTTPADDPAQRVGGPAVDGGVAVGVPDGPARLWAWLEARVQASPTAGALPDAGADVPDATVFAEVLGSAGVPLGAGVAVHAGGGGGIGGGIGTPAARGFVGVSFGSRPRPADPEPRGEPAALRWTVQVLGDGAPLAGASVRAGDVVLGRTGPDGVLVVEMPESVEVRRGTLVLHADAVGFASGSVDRARPGETTSIELVSVAQALDVRVTDAAGTPLAARIVARADGREVVASPALELSPGRWSVDVSLDGYGPQTRRAEVVAGVSPEPLGVVLHPVAGDERLRHGVVDADDRPVPGATVLIDGLPVGSTDVDGAIAIGGLATGPHRVTVQHPDYTEAVVDVAPSGGSTETRTRLDRVPGTVRVVARDASGDPIPDATVRFAGSRRLPPLPLGARGERVQVLGPGSWQVLVTSPRFGMQQRELVIPPDTVQVLEVEVVLQPPEDGTAALELRLVDPDGEPVELARVALDGRQLGVLSTGGTLLLDGLDVGTRVLEVQAPRHRIPPPIEIPLSDGLQEHVVVLPWNPGVVRVSARAPEGMAEDATVRFAGPGSSLPVSLGATGTGWFDLEPGSWSALVTSPTWGAQQRDFVLDAEGGRLTRVDVAFGELDAGLADLALTVVDPDGAPVVGADVRIDGLSLGRTTTGGLRADGLAVGRRALDVEAPAFASYTGTVRLLEGLVEREVPLQWAPGALRVRVGDADGRPVPDAIVRLLGPSARAPSPVDPDGTRVFVLEPGEWDLLAISPTKGLAQTRTEIHEDTEGIATVELTLRQPNPGFGELVVRAVDERGRPVSAAVVTLDGAEVGRSGPGGVVTVGELAPGPRRLRVTAPFHGAADTPLEVTRGVQVRYVTLPATPGSVRVTVTGPGGAPVDATITFVGPTDRASEQVGSDGDASFPLSPGSWRIVASAPGLAAARGEAIVPAGGTASVQLALSASRVERADTELVIRDVVLFDFDAATLRTSAGPVLDEVANALLSAGGGSRVEVRGHSDAVGDLAYNLALSQRRAESVRAALIARGVPPETVLARGFGAGSPVGPNDTDAGRAANRRVEFALLP